MSTITLDGSASQRITNPSLDNDSFITVGATRNKVSEFLRAGVLRSTEEAGVTSYFLASQNSELELSVNHIPE